MNNYEMEWIERKELLKSSLIFGTIVSFLFILFFSITNSAINSIGDVFEAFTAFLFFALVFTATMIVVKMIKRGGVGQGIFITLLYGVWTAAKNAFAGSMLGVALGVLIMIVFFWLFLIVVAIYAIYVPISSIYYYTMYKKQKA
ncbi:MAG: hypothetical protein GX379_06890 [Clostridiales bacterium]|nr:hypothetical protein [Clostridiales bacterium]